METIAYPLNMENKYMIPYINACIRAVAKQFNTSVERAFYYLYNFKGIHFLVEFHETEHLLSIEDAVDDLIVCCQNNGGHWHRDISKDKEISNIHKAQVQRIFLVSYIVDRLTEYLVMDYNMEVTDALKIVYQSKVYKQLIDEDGELYIQSPSYVYELLKREM